MSTEKASSAAKTPSKLPYLEYLPTSRQSSARGGDEKRNSNLDEKKIQGYLEEPKQQQQQPHSDATQMVSYFDEVNQNRESFWSKMFRLGKYNPFVPLGCLVTVGVLANGVWAMRKKDTAKSQRMMRYRIAAQGTTIIALVFGTMLSQFLITASPESAPAPASAPQRTDSKSWA